MTARQLLDFLQTVKDKDRPIRCYPGACPIVVAEEDDRLQEITMYLGADRNTEELKKI
jgi:hypothetical protein